MRAYKLWAGWGGIERNEKGCMGEGRGYKASFCYRSSNSEQAFSKANIRCLYPCLYHTQYTKLLHCHSPNDNDLSFSCHGVVPVRFTGLFHLSRGCVDASPKADR